MKFLEKLTKIGVENEKNVADLQRNIKSLASFYDNVVSWSSLGHGEKEYEKIKKNWEERYLVKTEYAEKQIESFLQKNDLRVVFDNWNHSEYILSFLPETHGTYNDHGGRVTEKIKKLRALLALGTTKYLLSKGSLEEALDWNPDSVLYLERCLAQSGVVDAMPDKEKEGVVNLAKEYFATAGRIKNLAYHPRILDFLLAQKFFQADLLSEIESEIEGKFLNKNGLDHHSLKEIECFCYSPSLFIRTKAKEFLRRLLNEHGLQMEIFEEIWGLSDYKKLTNTGDIAQNLEKIINLERKHPGASHILFNDFGIKEFRRYDMEQLIDLYEKKDVDSAYGVLATSNADWNGAFNKNPIPKDVYDDLEKNGFLTRMIEFNTPFELLKRLLFLEKKYGQKNKLSFVFLSMHGTPQAVSLGNKKEHELSTKVSKMHDKSNMFLEIENFFTEKPSVILNSCSAKSETGIIRALKEVFQANFQGPSGPASIKSVEVGFNDVGNPVFNVTFSDETEN